MNKANTALRSALKAAKIPYWRVAEQLGVHENTIVRMMRHELSDSDKVRFLKAISEIKKETA